MNQTNLLFDLDHVVDSNKMIATELRFTVLGHPEQRGSKKAITPKGGKFPMVVDMNEADSRPWMDAVKHAAWGAMRDVGIEKPLMGPIELTMQFFFLRPLAHYRTGRYSDLLKPDAPKYHAKSPDLDKLLRCIGDALTGIAYGDDKQVFRYGAGTQRFWCVDYERAEVVIREVV